MANIPVNPNLDKAQRKISTANLANFAGVDCQLLIEKETHRPIIMDGTTVGGAFKAASLDEVETKLGTLKPSSAGNADTATKLAAARNISISGAVTAAEVAFDGSDDVVLNATAVNGANVTGVVPEATKATQNNKGEVIEDTYVRKNLDIPSNGSTSTSIQVSGVNGSDSVLTAVQTQISNWKPTLGLLCRNGAQVYTQIVMSDNDMTFSIGPSKKIYLSDLIEIPETYATKIEVGNKADASHTHTPEDITGLDTAYLPVSGGTLSGDLTVSGKISGSSFQATSDARKKKNITDCSYLVNQLFEVSPYSYQLINEQDKTRIGVIAQDLLKANLTQVVFEDEQGYYSVDYNGLTALLIGAVRSLQQRIDVLENKLKN